ncbi:dpoa decarboxylase (plasmid) [Pantoea agglomerans]|uniref:dpoa decarboxylase n=1 Tax=Enterobacter agglomerans TaxID=549 RepID=UPI00177AF92B|nr:dpoa decarboxylase [Pantoea agglomerans]MBD8234744.1 dpoa decarboxylase [Pantoea agglomerans]WVL83424.1 dpoa decarboxylase [Pantoea agglomerans]WVL83451.1 dpoa decarboxylase [Pantoea agglomerans]
MINDIFIQNIKSKNKDRISAAVVYDLIEKEAHRGCGLHYEIYKSRLIGGLLEHIAYLNEKDATTLREYAEQKETRIDDDAYRDALEAERQCWAEIYRDQM